MAQNQQSRIADDHWTIESGSNARIADVFTYSVESHSVGDKVDFKAGGYAARPVFEFADVVRA